GTGFESLFQSALNMVNETDTLTNKAEEEGIKYSLGYSDSALDLMVAQTKANTSLQFTVAVRDKVLEAYKEIMNMQF
ncbi:MAG TPA: flagellar hook-basal body complex protein FliE, partial [Lachnospiraceae bacterium]|uniref:flagellar hook-basal body complex protein FliE n=1 Tax=Anaerosporobacter sp. TaxID=1872529 RepID=UPI000EEA052F